MGRTHLRSPEGVAWAPLASDLGTWARGHQWTRAIKRKKALTCQRQKPEVLSSAPPGCRSADLKAEPHPGCVVGLAEEVATWTRWGAAMPACCSPQNGRAGEWGSAPRETTRHSCCPRAVRKYVGWSTPHPGVAGRTGAGSFPPFSQVCPRLGPGPGCVTCGPRGLQAAAGGGASVRLTWWGDRGRGQPCPGDRSEGLGLCSVGSRCSSGTPGHRASVFPSEKWGQLLEPPEDAGSGGSLRVA